MAFDKKALKDKYRDFKKIFRENWKLFKQSKLGIAGIIIIVFFVFMAILAPILTDRPPTQWTAPNKDMFDADQLYNRNEWNTTAPSSITGLPALRDDEESFYLVGKEEGPTGETESNLYWIMPGKGSPTVDKIELEGEGTSTPEVYPELNDPDPKFSSWDERVYIGTTDGILYRVYKDFSDNLHVGWSFDLSAHLNREVSIQHTPILAEVRAEEYWGMVIVATNNSIHAIKDTREGNTNPHLVWNQTLEGTISDPSNLQLNQPDIFKNPKSNALEDTMTVAVTSRGGELILLNYTDGSVLWNFNIREVTGEDVSLTRPVIPFNVKKGDIPEQIYYTSADDGNIYIIPNNKTVEPGDIGSQNVAYVREDAHLTIPEVQANGKGVWVASNKDGQGTMHYISRDELTVGPEERESSWNFKLRGTVSGKPYFFIDNGYVYIATDNGFVYCFSGTYSPDQMVWTAEIGGSPENVFILPNKNPNFLKPVLMIIHSGERSAEGWQALGKFLAPLSPSWATNEEREEKYLLGTDNQGRDIWSQLVYGSRIALIVGFAAAFIAVIIGTSVGVAAGYLGGTVDVILMRVVDVFLCMPSLALLIVFVAVLGASIWNIVLVIAIIGWPGIARVIRSQTLSLKERPFVDSAKVAGASKTRIMFRHIVPNVMPLSLLYMTFQITGAILAEANLSFLGLGDPTTTSWGQMLYSLTRGSGSTFTAWWWFFPPGLCIMFLVLGFFFISRAFDEIINPRLRERR